MRVFKFLKFFAFSTFIVLTSCSTMDFNNKRLKQTSATRSEESIQLKKFYERTSRRLKSRGLLRTDSGAIDSPYSAKTLTKNFTKIALYDEYVIKNGAYIAEETKSKLKRWETPIVINIIHGKTNAQNQIRIDKTNIEDLTKKLSVLTDLSIKIEETRGNFIILFLDINEQEKFGEKLKALLPLLTPSMAKAIISSPRSTFCSAFTLTKPSNDYEYVAAIILVKSEHTNLMRKSCIHEEIAQAMGLSNDSKFARPSIFNDDEEFALLTKHDENLLKILYDNRLQTGMDSNESIPIVAKIANELLSRQKTSLFNSTERD